MTLLPAPAHITYAPGFLRVSDLCLAPETTLSEAEDRFAVEALHQGLQTRLPGCTAGTGVSLRLKRTGALDPLPLPNEQPGSTSREAYRLSISKTGIAIEGRSSAAVYYGVQTLLQMLEHDQDGSMHLPFAEVQDWPALSYRGTLIDAGSEGPMLTVAEIKRQLDFLAKWKANQYFLYSEGNIELRGYPLLNPKARFTQPEIREIVAYARARHIDVVPAVEMYAHLHDLFRIEKYSGLADFAHGGEFDPRNPQVKKVLADWAAQLNDLFPSKFVDIGFDETWSLQKAADSNGATSTPVQLFIDQLTTVTGLFQASGKTVMAYADIMVKFPGIVPRLPKGLIALPWWYEPIHDAEEKRWLEPLVREKVPHIVTSGVTSWDQIAPDFSLTFSNIDTFLAAGRRSKTLGLLNTTWTDDGQVLLQMSWPGMAYGAAAAWQRAPMHPESFFQSYSALYYAPPAVEQMTRALTELSLAETNLQNAIGRETMNELWQNPFRAASLKKLSDKREELREARLHAEAALEDLYALREAAPHTAHLDSFIAGAQMIDLAGMKFLYAAEIADAWKSLPAKPTREQLLGVLGQGISNEAHSRLLDLMDGFTETKETYRAAWAQQYTPYRLGTALGHWDAEYDFWRRAQANFENLRAEFKTGDTLPSVQQLTSAN